MRVKRLSFGTLFRFYFVAALPVTGALFASSLYSYHSVTNIKDQVIQYQAAYFINLRELEFLIENRVSKNRAYLLSGNPVLLTEMAQIQERYMSLIHRLKGRAADNEARQTLKQIEDAVILYDDSADRGIALRRNDSSPEQILNYFDSDLNPKRFDVRQTLAQAIAQEEDGFAKSRVEARQAAENGLLLLIGSGAFALFSLFVLWALLERSLRTKEKLDRKLQDSNEELEQFAAIAAHDLRSPLQSMIAWSQVLDQAAPKPRNKDFDQALGFIQQAAQRGLDLVRDLLDMARLNTSNQSLILVDANQIVNSVINVLSPQISSAQASVSVGKLPQIWGIPSHIETLFSNLIRNAITYRHQARKPLIEISARDMGARYEFSVADNGIGIREEDQKDVFKMFKRVNARGDVSGTGIGLAMCKKVLDLRGGNIRVKSLPESGSTFIFEYPKTKTGGLSQIGTVPSFTSRNT